MVPCQLPIPNSCPLWPLPNLVLLRPVCLLPSPPTEHHSLNFVLPACPESAHSNCHTSGMVDATFFPSSSHLLQSSRVKLPIRVRGCGSCRTTDLMEGRRSRNHATPPPRPLPRQNHLPLMQGELWMPHDATCNKWHDKWLFTSLWVRDIYRDHPKWLRGFLSLF